jgi:hypothetical protein
MAILKKKSEEEDDEWDPEEEEQEEEGIEFEKPLPKKPMEVARTNKFAPQPKPQAENRFVAVHSPAIDGIMDKKTNKLVTADLWEIQAEMLSILQRIEESLG